MTRRDAASTDPPSPARAAAYPASWARRGVVDAHRSRPAPHAHCSRDVGQYLRVPPKSRTIVALRDAPSPVSCGDAPFDLEATIVNVTVVAFLAQEARAGADLCSRRPANSSDDLAYARSADAEMARGASRSARPHAELRAIVDARTDRSRRALLQAEDEERPHLIGKRHVAPSETSDATARTVLGLDQVRCARSGVVTGASRPGRTSVGAVGGKDGQVSLGREDAVPGQVGEI
jgi:hypothetical protein